MNREIVFITIENKTTIMLSGKNLRNLFLLSTFLKDVVNDRNYFIKED